jgi:hypothetical protein
MGAVAVSFIEPLLNALGIGWAFTILSGLSVSSFFTVWMNIHFGPTWRRKIEADANKRLSDD